MLKKLHLNILLQIVFTLAGGVLLMIFPSAGTRTLSTIAGTVIALFGLLQAVLSCVRKKEGRCRIAQGLAMVFAGLFMLLRTELFSALIPYLLSFAVLGLGCAGLQEAFLDRRKGGDRVMWHAAAGAISIVLGILLCVIPFADSALHTLLIGVALTVSAVLKVLACYVQLPKKQSAEA